MAPGLATALGAIMRRAAIGSGPGASTSTGLRALTGARSKLPLGVPRGPGAPLPAWNPAPPGAVIGRAGVAAPRALGIAVGARMGPAAIAGAAPPGCRRDGTRADAVAASLYTAVLAAHSTNPKLVLWGWGTRKCAKS